MPTKPTILNNKIVAHSKLFAIEQLHLRFSNGQERYYERLVSERPQAVMMVPMLDADTVLLVREYGAGIENYFLGLPKGILEKDEDIYVAANRELMEEVGYGAHRFRLLKTLATSPGYMSSRMHTLLAEDLYPQSLPGDEPEPLEVVPWSLKRLPELLQRDDFFEARSVAALFMVRELLHAR